MSPEIKELLRLWLFHEKMTLLAVENLKLSMAQTMSVNELLWNQSLIEGVDMSSLIKEARRNESNLLEEQQR